MIRCLTLIACAAVLWSAGASNADAARMRPGHYAYSLLVFGNADELHAAGCLRWQVQLRAWYNTCAAGHPAIAVKY